MLQQAITAKSGGREGVEQNDPIPLQVRPWQYSQHL